MALFYFIQASISQQSKLLGGFSRLARKRRVAQVGESKFKGEVEEYELQAQVEEEGIENLVRNIIDEISVIHLIMFDTYVI